ncbi:MAG: peptidylprolyl isomerase [Alphaproteobacteria bacterium]|jgi:peptidyl-prolyl cis-trans isomerase SurA|nr:peptidylprolyl isomerase [Alphaproteobacteria bacterium]
MNFLTKLLYLTFLLLLSTGISANSNRMLAVVNDNFVIFDHDLEKEIVFQKVVNPQGLKSESLDKDLKLLILNQMIINHLVLEDSVKFKVQVNVSDINSAIEFIEKENKKPSGFLVSEAKRLGLSQNEFYAMMRASLTVDKMKQIMSFSRSKVSNYEAEAELKRVLNLNGRVEMLLYEISISFKNISKEDAESKINSIYLQLQKGENFQTLAKNFSDDISSITGGEIGWVPEIFLPSEILININQLRPNQHSKPFILGNSYKIILLKDVRPLLYIDINNPEHLEQLTNYAKQKILNDKAQVALEDYLEEIKQRASITIYNENL